jgi:hypothetical protein
VIRTAVTAAGALADSFLPLGQLGWEFILGLGLAFAGGNLWALMRPGYIERRTGKRQPRPPDPRRVIRNVVIGLVVAVIGLVGLIGSLQGS